MSLIYINKESCTKCGLCIFTCSKEVINRQSEQDIPCSGSPENCSICGHCVAVCPTGALAHTKMEDSSFEEIRQEIDPEGLAQSIASRRSVRRFETRPLEREEIERLLQAAANAPQAKNSRRQGYAVVTDRDKIREMDIAVVRSYEKLLKILSGPVRFILRLVKPSLAKELAKNLPSLGRLVKRGS